MEAAIINQSKTFTLYGHSKVHDQNKPYSATIFELLDRVWEEVRNKKLSHTGISHVVYEVSHHMFAGIELISPPEGDCSLEVKMISFQKYVYCKHIGPYSKLDATYQKIRSLVETSDDELELPLIEVYGHWTEDESKLETEIFHNLK
jgi:effector-binding domain-containing protein